MSMLLMYVIVPLLFTAPLMRFVLVRRLIGFRDMRKGVFNPAFGPAGDVRSIYQFGTKRGPQQIGELALFETSPGAKYLPPLLIVWMIVLMFQMEEINGVDDWVSLVIFIAGSAYLCAVNFRTRIVVDGNLLHKTDYLFRHQTFDLADLVRAEQDGSESYRLEFADGRSTYILRWISGHDALKGLLSRALEINGR